MALDLNDKSANSNTLTNSGADEITSSLPFAASSEAVQLIRANGDYLYANDHSSLDLSTTGTIEFWVKLTDLPGANVNYGLVGKDNNPDRAYSIFYYNNNNDAGQGYYQFRAICFGNSTYDYYFWNVTLTAGVWYHVALTIDTGEASATTFELYVDTVSQGNGTAANAGNVTTIDNTSSALYLGADYNTSNLLNGYLDDVRIWNDVRTSTEIEDNYDTELTGSESNLVAYWPFEAISSSGRRMMTGMMQGLGN